MTITMIHPALNLAMLCVLLYTLKVLMPRARRLERRKTESRAMYGGRISLALHYENKAPIIMLSKKLCQSYHASHTSIRIAAKRADWYHPERGTAWMFANHFVSAERIEELRAEPRIVMTEAGFLVALVKDDTEAVEFMLQYGDDFPDAALLEDTKILKEECKLW